MNHLIQEYDLKKAVKNADFIVEAIPEIMELKQDLFQKLGNIAPTHAIFATNTSTMSITDIASTSGREDKVIGMHFFTPIVVLRLIELIKGSKTSQETFDRSYEVSIRFPSIKGKRYIAKINNKRVLIDYGDHLKTHYLADRGLYDIAIKYHYTVRHSNAVKIIPFPPISFYNCIFNFSNSLLSW